MLRIAKVCSWLLLGAYLLLIVVSVRDGFSIYSPGAPLMLAPAALALGVFYSRAPRWLAWAAIFLNVVAVCLGLYMVGEALPDLLGLKSSPDAQSASIYLAIALLVFVVPCGFNVAALYGVAKRRKPPSGATPA